MELSNKELGQYLRTIREGLGYSIYDVNKLCDISPSYLSLMENGKRKPSAIILKKLAPIYSLDYLELYVKAGYVDLAKYEKQEISVANKSSVSSNNINTDGLTKDEIEEINKFVEFLKSKKKGQKK